MAEEQTGPAHSLRTRVIAKQEFAGNWEFVLDGALVTAPARLLGLK